MCCSAACSSSGRSGFSRTSAPISSPARPICDRETNNRCSPVRLERYERSLGYENPVYEEYGKFVKGVFVGRTITIFPTDYDCPAPCLGYSYRTKVPVWDEMKERLPATLSVALGGAALYLIFGVPIGVAAMALNQSGAGPTAVIDATSAITDVRLEAEG